MSRHQSGLLCGKCAISQYFLLSAFVCPGSVREQQGSLQPDPEIVNQLVGMGFSENGSKRAAVATQVSNMGVAAAQQSCKLVDWWTAKASHVRLHTHIHIPKHCFPVSILITLSCILVAYGFCRYVDR